LKGIGCTLEASTPDPSQLIPEEEAKEAKVGEQRDHYWRKAKQEGFRSRSAYKLLEIQKKFKMFRKGDRVLDLGCAPGGWLQLIAAEVGPKGKVVGVDLKKTEALSYANVALIQGDITRPEVQSRIRQVLGEDAHVVTSDLSPNLTGIHFQDHLRSCDLVKDALAVARGVLAPGGIFLVKVFQGEELESIIRDLKEDFGQIRRVVPSASRKASSEIYILARGFRAPSE
jgi:23S rRNA (uridine2552-2'-O)-methyltransferase